MNVVCKRRENWGGEVWSCLYTQMRLLETGWLEIGHDQFHHLDAELCKRSAAVGGKGNTFRNMHVFERESNPVCSHFPLQNIKVTIMDLEATTTSSPTALRPRRLSLQPNPPTSWALDQEPWRGQATTLQMTKGSRTWSLTQKPPVQTRAYQAPCSLSQGRLTGVDRVHHSPWLVTPVTVLPCPIKVQTWEKPLPGKEQTTGTIPGLSASPVHSGEPWKKNTVWGKINFCNFYGGLFKIMDWFSQVMDLESKVGQLAGKSDVLSPIRQSKAYPFLDYWTWI